MAKSPKSNSQKKSEILDCLDIRERKYIEGRLAGKSKKAAGLEAGFSESMASSAVAKIESKDVRRAFQELARAAVPAAKIALRLQEGMDAIRIKPVVSGKDVIAKIEEPDYRERREHLVLAAKFGGHYVDKSELDVTEETNVSPSERIRQLLERALERSSRSVAISQ